MARNIISSDLVIKAIKPGDPRGRLNDGDGLYLLLFVKGGAHGWRFAYSLDGKRNNISLGESPWELWRLQPLRRWSHEQVEQVLT